MVVTMNLSREMGKSSGTSCWGCMTMSKVDAESGLRMPMCGFTPNFFGLVVWTLYATGEVETRFLICTLHVMRFPTAKAIRTSSTSKLTSFSIVRMQLQGSCTIPSIRPSSPGLHHNAWPSDFALVVITRSATWPRKPHKMKILQICGNGDRFSKPAMTCGKVVEERWTPDLLSLHFGRLI